MLRDSVDDADSDDRLNWMKCRCVWKIMMWVILSLCLTLSEIDGRILLAFAACGAQMLHSNWC